MGWRTGMTTLRCERDRAAVLPKQRAGFQQARGVARGWRPKCHKRAMFMSHAHSPIQVCIGQKWGSRGGGSASSLRLDANSQRSERAVGSPAESRDHAVPAELGSGLPVRAAKEHAGAHHMHRRRIPETGAHAYDAPALVGQ